MEKLTVIFNVGVSGSGKTTKTIQHLKEDSNFLRINRDDIRKTLVGSLIGYYQRPDLKGIEPAYSSLEGIYIIDLLSQDYNIIIDNTNLTPTIIEDKIDLITRSAEEFQKEVEIKFRIFSLDDKFILRDRVKDRDNLSWEDTKYIERQISQFQAIVPYLQTKYKDQII